MMDAEHRRASAQTGKILIPGVNVWIKEKYLFRAGLVVSLAVSALIAGLLLVLVRETLSAPAVYLGANYTELTDPVCPGDVITVVVPVRVENPPLNLTVGESFYAVDTQTLIIPAGVTAAPPRVFADGVPIARISFEIKVPAFPPGQYEYWRGNGVPAPDVLRVPFTIPENCTEAQ